MQERRRRTRVSFGGEVELRTPDGSQRVLKLKDISLGGLYAYADEAIPAGTRCEMKIRLEGAGEDLTLHGRVVRTDHRGVGVVFEEMAPEAFVVLKRLVELNATEPERIEVELQGPRS